MLGYDALLSNLKDNHVETLRQLRKMATSTHKQIRIQCGVACVYARQLKMDAKRRAEFYAEAFPKGWRRFHRVKLLLHVLMYFYGVTNRKSVGYGTASAHSVALRDVYEDQKMSDDEVMQHIVANGVFLGLQHDDDDNVTDEDEEGLPQPESVDRGPRRRAKAATIFSDQEDDDLVVDEHEAEQEDDPSDEANTVVRRPVRKPPAPAVSLPRLPWRYVQRSVMGWPETAAIKEAILGAFRDNKAVWVTAGTQESVWNTSSTKGAGPVHCHCHPRVRSGKLK